MVLFHLKLDLPHIKKTIIPLSLSITITFISILPRPKTPPYISLFPGRLILLPWEHIVDYSPVVTLLHYPSFHLCIGGKCHTACALPQQCLPAACSPLLFNGPCWIWFLHLSVGYGLFTLFIPFLEDDASLKHLIWEDFVTIRLSQLLEIALIGRPEVQ